MSYENIIDAIKNACITISISLKKGDTSELSNKIGYINKSGDFSNNIDLHANEILKKELIKCENIWGIASEEDEGIISRFSDEKDCSYFVSFDPLDGSSNVDCNISVGTIFCIFKCEHGVFPKGGKDIVCAGYCLYSQCTQLVLADEINVKMYTLHPHIKTFENEEIVTIPENGCIYSINESNKYKWIKNDYEKKKDVSLYYEYINQLSNENYSMRWVGTMVADCHRTLLKGGFFSYPADNKNTEGKIRLVYEAFPFAYIFMRAGGFSSNGFINILQLIFPKDIHQKTPVLLSSKKEFFQFIELSNSYY